MATTTEENLNKVRESRFCTLTYIHELYVQLYEQRTDPEAGEAGEAGLPKTSTETA